MSIDVARRLKNGETISMPSKHRRWILLSLLPFVASCNLLTPLVFIGEHRKKVSPEFDKLAGRRVAILVWTDPSTLFDYPYARFELATYIGDKLYPEMTRRELDTEVIDPRDVEDFIQKNVNAEIDPNAVGDAFDADYVVYVEVLKFQFRNPEQPQFLRGEIHASVSVHDVRADPDQLRRYELAPVQCQYPDGAPILMTATNPRLIRQATYRKFAEQVARKFYEHTVEL
ncbi:MAG: hypothetical protein JSU86_13460 [Phycisphaerales bacterium]|nr:MAG: hypothetical protein JSU86_13460 [Phycisphaerales bacterium]